MQNRHKPSTQAGGDVRPRPTAALKLRKRQVRWIAVVGLGVIFCSLALHASADPTIYLLDSSGTPVNVTSSYVWQNHFLYDFMQNIVGTVDDSGHIFNLSGQQIGYIDGLPIGGPP